MSNYQPVILDADWATDTDEDLIRNHFRLLGEERD